MPFYNIISNRKERTKNFVSITKRYRDENRQNIRSACWGSLAIFISKDGLSAITIVSEPIQLIKEENV